jgi:hypothetical protein
MKEMGVMDMSRSKRDQKGRRINGEVGFVKLRSDGSISRYYGFDGDGGAIGKRDRKRDARRAQRSANKIITNNGMEGEI